MKLKLERSTYSFSIKHLSNSGKFSDNINPASNIQHFEIQWFYFAKSCGKTDLYITMLQLQKQEMAMVDFLVLRNSHFIRQYQVYIGILKTQQYQTLDNLRFYSEIKAFDVPVISNSFLCKSPFHFLVHSEKYFWPLVVLKPQEH